MSRNIFIDKNAPGLIDEYFLKTHYYSVMQI